MTAEPAATGAVGPMSAKQIKALRESTGRVNIWEGSIRSGKTISSLLAWAIFIATSAPGGGELVVVSRTRDSAARNVFGPLKDKALFGELSKHVKYTAGAPTGTILGRTVHVFGATDVKAELVIRGMTCAGAYVDEVTVLTETFFTQLLGRMSLAGARLFGTTNPDSPAHWFKKKFLDRLAELGNWRRWHFVLADNPSLTQEYIDAVSKEYTGLWYRRFILGEWVAAEGAVYSMWDTARHVAAWDELPRMQRLLGVGIDYGTTNPTAAVMLGLSETKPGEHGGRLYLLDEYRHDPAVTQRRLTDAQLSSGLRAWLAGDHIRQQLGQAKLEPEWIIADPSAASFRTQLMNDGLATMPADNDVAYGIRTTASLLGDGQLIVADRCTGLVEEVPGYSWDTKATDKGEDKPVKVADHSLDAARYAVVTTEPLWRGELATLSAA